MSLISGLINTLNSNFCLSSSITQFQQFKKDVLNSATQDAIINVHNMTQFTYGKINCVPKDLSCETQLPNILRLALLVSNASSSSTKSFNSLTQMMISF